MGKIFKPITKIIDKFIGWLIPVPTLPDFDTPEEQRGVLINKQSNNAQIPVVYGRRKVGITRVFIESSGTDNKYLYIAGVVCEGEIEEIEQIFIDDKRVIFDGDLTDGTVREVSDGDGNFYKSNTSRIRIQAFYGTDTQSASSVLTDAPSWTSDHKLSGVCYLAFRFTFDKDAFSGIPQVKVVLRGKKVYDPRTSSTKWTPNSALVLLDYLRNTRYGKGLPDSAFETNFASFQTVATDADTLIQPRTTSVTVVAGLISELYSGYYNDNLNFFVNRSITASSTVTSISGQQTSQYNSRRYFGYFTAPSSASFEFATDSDDSSRVYIGDASQTVDNLFKEVQNNRNSKLIVNNGGVHGNRGASGSKTLVSGSVYPVIIYYGNAPTNSNLTFKWRVSGGSYSTSLSSNFSNGISVTDLIPKIIKFESNAVVDTSQKVIDNVKKLLNPMRSLFTYTNGQYKLKVEGTGTSFKTITEDNVVGGAKVIGERKNNKYNRVIGTYVNPYKNWQNDTVTFPPADDSNVVTEFKHATMLSADNNTVLEGNFQFPNVTNTYNAEALCEVILRRSRQQLQIQLTLTSEFLELEIGDIVAITYPSGGFSAKPFRVLGLEINEDLTVNVQLFEHQDNFYNFNTKNPISTIPDTILPNITKTVDISALSEYLVITDAVAIYNDGVVITKLIITLGDFSTIDSFFDYVEVEVSEDGVNYTSVGTGKQTRYEVLNVKDKTLYYVRVRYVNTAGSKSNYLIGTHTTVGQTAPPANVQNFSINVTGTTATLSWDAVADLDLSYYIIKYTSNIVNPLWAKSKTIVSKIARPATSATVPFQAGSYLIKAVDKGGNLSLIETVIKSSISTANYVSQTTINEHTGFSGSKTNVAVTSINSTNHLGLTASGTLGDPNTTVQSSGIYAFANQINFAGKLKAKFDANVIQTTDQVNEYIDTGRPLSSTLIDAGTPDPFDGTATQNSDSILQISTSDDNVTYSSFTAFNTGEYIGRYFKFRVSFTSSDNKARQLITQLSITASLQERTESGADIASGTGGKAVTYSSAFASSPSLNISGQNMLSGDRFAITSKSASGFTIEFFNSSGTSIDRTFDFFAKGVGQIIT